MTVRPSITDVEALTRLQHVGHLCSRADADFDECLREILDTAIALASSDKGNLQLLDEDGGTLRIAVQRGFQRPFLRFFESVTAKDPSACGATMLASKRTLVPDVAKSEIFRGQPALRVLVDAGVRAVQSTPLVSSEGNILGAVSTHSAAPRRWSERELRYLDLLARQAADFLQRKKSEDALRASKAALEALLVSERVARSEADRAVRSKDDFLAMLSHELRTPLNAIAGWTHLLVQGAADREKVLECAEVIERNTKIQTRLISDLLDMSRITSGKMRLEFTRIDVPLAVTAAVESVRPIAKSKGLELRTSIESLGGGLVGDPGRFAQIVDNLLSNALKFTPRGGAIEVTLEEIDGRLELRVEDTGEGIQKEFLPHVFDRFRQGDSSAARKFGGLGLGLALVKQLAELHGGTVEARSEGRSRGSIFLVRLPLEPDEERPRLLTVADRRTAPEPMDLHGVSVLVIDDDLDTLEVVRRLLEDLGAQVTICDDADEGLAVLDRSSVDVVVSDIGLPGRDGYDFIREVRASGNSTPAIALTAFARDEDRARVLAAGYQAHVTKPMRPAELIATVASLVGSRRAHPAR